PTEHYGAVMNRPFRFEPYLADAAEKGITLTRLFMLFRELQVPMNPYSTCKPESPEYVAPFVRTRPGRALDGEPKFDLDQPNPEFFGRLHRFLSLASDYGIIVEVVLLSNTYTTNVWNLNPLNPANNVNSLPESHWQEYVTRRHAAMVERQAAHVRKIVTETNRYDNVIYEICNEPGIISTGPEGYPTPDDTNDWLNALIAIVRETEAGLTNKHLVVGQESYVIRTDPAVTLHQPSDKAFHDMDYDVVNMHPLPNSWYGGTCYQMGDFMSKQLKLRDLRDYGLATYTERKPLNQDEDNIASQYRDPEGWTIHRKRAWVTLLSGGHYDVIDFSIQPWLETGTPESQRHIRT
ncbi:MAG: glycoside hydrolase family 5 protein, partial [Anaerolineae bacterium]|nr:glycoside hydrolase family 5 protein [Anaerolineae bacterium]